MFVQMAECLVFVWKEAINAYEFQANNTMSVDPLESLSHIPEILTERKLKLAQYLQQYGSEMLHEAFDNKNHDEKLSLMKIILDFSDYFQEVYKEHH